MTKAISTSILLRRLDEPGKEPERHSITGRSEDFALEGIRPGRYEVQLHEEVLGPRVAPDATAFKTEDMVERTVPLGEVEIRVGETARFEAAVPIEREGGG